MQGTESIEQAEQVHRLEGLAREREVHLGGSTVEPRTSSVPCTDPGMFGVESAGLEFAEAGATAFPLGPEDAPQSAAHPGSWSAFIWSGISSSS